MKKIKLSTPPRKVNTHIGTLVLGLLIGILLTTTIGNFASTHIVKLQSPIIIQMPILITSRPKLSDILINASNSADLSTPLPSPTPPGLKE